MFTDFSESIVKMPGRRFSIPRHQRIDSAEPVTNPCQLEFCPPTFFPSYLHHVVVVDRNTGHWKDEEGRVPGCEGYSFSSDLCVSIPILLPTFASTTIPHSPSSTLSLPV